jgi:hypothetical protein
VWWVWLIPSIVVAGALTAAIAGGVEVWRGTRSVRRRLDALRADVTRIETMVADLGAEAAQIRDR